MPGRHLKRTIAVSMCVVSLHGCGDTTFLRYSQNLSDKAQGSSAKVQKFYSALQSEHSQMRLDEVKMQAEAATPLDPATPGPICPFTTDDVDSRVKSARFIELYSIKFNELVRKRNANEMQQAISDVSGQLAGFNIKNFNPLATLQSASTPITTGLKIAGRRGFSLWADRWLKQALSQSDAVFVEQATQLKLELNADADQAKTRATGLQNLAERVYRKKVAAHAAPGEIKEASDELQRISNFRQKVATDPPTLTYEEILECHRLLMTQVPDKFKKK